MNSIRLCLISLHSKVLLVEKAIDLVKELIKGFPKLEVAVAILFREELKELSILREVAI